MEEMRPHLKAEHPATSPPIVVTVDRKDPASTLTQYQACLLSRLLCSPKHSFSPRIATYIISYGFWRVHIPYNHTFEFICKQYLIPYKCHIRTQSHLMYRRPRPHHSHQPFHHQPWIYHPLPPMHIILAFHFQSFCN
jgi:hypothetical protein